MPSGVRRLLVGLFVLAQVSQGGAQTARKGDDLVPVQGYGVGMNKTCGAFIQETDERDADQALSYKGKRYHPERRLYFEWLSGFFTARSVASGATVAGDRNMNDMISWIRHYCEAHPLDNFLTAALKLSSEVSQ